MAAPVRARVLLHEHLDGSIRPATLIDLARPAHVTLPASDEGGVRAFFKASAQGSLPRYLSLFALTTACLQTPDALRRVAAEAVCDLAAEGVVYAELRFAPSLHLGDPHDALAATIAGFSSALSGRPGLDVRLLVCALRDRDPAESLALARAASRFPGPVVGFDLAGPEAGFPASAHRAAIEHARTVGLGVTVHAGEGAGPVSVADALDAGAQRIGHGVRLAEEIALPPTGSGLGPTAARVRGSGVHLEVCPTSNLDTGVFTPASHPAVVLHRAGFSVSLNTDNRLVSDTSLEAEERFCRTVLGATESELAEMNRAAARSAFLDEPARAALLTRLG